MNNPLEPEIVPPIRRGIYLLPNLFTTAGLFAGFYAIVSAMKGLFDVAAVAIFIAMIADSLDGRVARLTNTQSAFGAEYDSLSDMVAFGIAPALVAYSWGLQTFGKLGWLAAFCYAAATGLRLARFNVQVGKPQTSKRFFQGLPCPAAAAILTATIWMEHTYLGQGWIENIVVAIITLVAAVLMVSNFLFFSFKDIDLKGRVPFIYMLMVIIIFVAIALNPPLVLFIAFLLYMLSGPAGAIWRFRRRRHRKVIITEHLHEESADK